MRIKSLFHFAAAAAATALALCGCFAGCSPKIPDAPAVISQPSDVMTREGNTVTFEVSAEGGGLSYQWYYKKPDAVKWSVWTGHDTAVTTSVANATWNGMRVYCRIADSKGHSVATRAAKITLSGGKPPVITLQPRDVTVNPGETAYFRVEAKGKGLKYQWYFRKGASRLWTVWKGHTDRETSAVANVSWSQMQVCCLVTDRSGQSVLSAPASVHVADCPTVISQPRMPGQQADGRLTFTASGGTEGLVYQWFFLPRGLPWGVKLQGQTEAVLSLGTGAFWKEGQVYCRLKSPGGRMAFSRAVPVVPSERPTVTLRFISESAVTPGSADILITSQPEDATVSSGKAATFSVKAEGKGLRYQWIIQKPGFFGWLPLRGQTGSRFTGIPDASWHGARIRCRMTNDRGETVYSREAVVTVNDLFTLHASPTNVTAETGQKAAFAVEATGRGLTYQWRRKTSGSERWRTWEGMTAPSLTLPAETDWHKMSVRCDVRDCTGKILSSDSASVWITDALDILRQPRGISVRAYEPAQFSVAAQGKGLRYQWYYRKPGMTNWHLWKHHTTPVTEALSNPTWDGMKVMCVITDSRGDRMVSHSARVRIVEA